MPHGMTAQPQVVGADYRRICTSPNDWRQGPFVGSPTIVRLSSGRLLAATDLFSANCGNDTSYVHGSDDDGEGWRQLAVIEGLFWPSLFQCASGLYVIGVTPGGGRARGDLCISRSRDNGETWTAPQALTAGLAVHTGNTGALVSAERVTVSFELCPQECQPLPKTITRAPLRIEDADLDTRTVTLPVDDPSVFVTHALVAIEADEVRLHARILDVGQDELTIRPERWAAVASHPRSPANSAGPWEFAPGARVTIASGTLGNNRDFWVMAADADARDDLCEPSAWRFSNAIANPAYTHANALHELFSLNFVPRDRDGVPNTELRAAWSGWLEGVLVRLEHPGGDGSILNLMRIAAGGTANISARIRIDPTADKLRCSFGGFGFDPGLGCTHGCVQYDPRDKLYWLASNVNRDSSRDLSGIPLTGGGATQERSNLALFCSRNCRDWFMVGLIAYSPDWVHSFHYPHFVIEGEDLLFAVRSHIESPLTEATIHRDGVKTADNHNSNAATFHRVRDFRSLANLEFLNYETS